MADQAGPAGLSKTMDQSSYRESMVRRDSMFSAFRMGSAASERGLCDINRVVLRVNTSCHMIHVSENREVLARCKYLSLIHI